MAKPFKIVSANVEADKHSVESYAEGRDATVVIGFDTSLTKLERRQVEAEAAKRVGDDARVSFNGPRLNIRTREFEPVREFIEAANTYAAQWMEDVERREDEAKAALTEAAASLKSAVIWQMNDTEFH